MIPLADDPGQKARTAPIVMLLLLAANVLAFIYELSLSERELARLVSASGVIPREISTGLDLPPRAPGGVVWLTLFTSMFLHGGLLHIGSNMLYLWVFGDNVEDGLGHGRFFLFYLLCGIAASLVHVVVNLGSPVPSIGASGAISGVLAGYFLMFPRAMVRTLIFIGFFFTVTRISALLLIGFWFVLQFLQGIASLGVQSEQTSGVAFWAHIGGFVAGLVLVKFFRPSRAPAMRF